jgi:hypothetical protein
MKIAWHKEEFETGKMVEVEDGISRECSLSPHTINICGK